MTAAVLTLDAYAPAVPLANGRFLEALIGPLLRDGDMAWVCSFNETPTSRSPWSGHLIVPGSANILSAGFNNYFSVSTFPPGADGRRLTSNPRPFVLVIDDARDVVLPPTYTIRTSPDKVQIGYALAEVVPVADYAKLTDFLNSENFIGGDPSGNNGVRYVRLPRGRNWKYTPTFETVLEQWNPERRYRFAEICAAFGFDPAEAPARAARPTPASGAQDGATVTEGGRNDALTRLAGSLRRASLSPEAMEAALLVENAARCVPPLDADEVRTIARSVGRYPPGDDPPRSNGRHDDPFDPPPHAPAAPPHLWARDTQPMLDCDYIIKGIIDRLVLALLYGATSCGKTFFAIDMLMTVAAGLPWRGRRTKRALVVYVAAEAGKSLQRRVYAWRKKHNLLDADTPFVIRYRSVALMSPDEVRDFIDELRAIPNSDSLPLVVCVDTVSRSMQGGDENRELPALVSACDLLRDELGATVLLIHHTGKTGTDPRGHSSLPAAVDVSLSVQTTPCRAAVAIKVRDAPTGTAFKFDLPVFDLGPDIEGDHQTTCVVEHGDEGMVETAARGPTLSDAARIALDALAVAVGEHGVVRTGGGVRAVSVSVWRAAFDAQTATDPLPDERPERRREMERRRKEFGRARDRLLAVGLVEIVDGMAARVV